MKKMIGIVVLLVALTTCINTPVGDEKTVTTETVAPPDDYSEYEAEYQQMMEEIETSFPQGAIDGTIAVLRVHGTLNVEDVLPIAEKLRKIEESNVQGLILWIDSPGGSVAAVTQITYEILRFKKRKPIVAHIGGYGASGAYYIASVCDKIVARRDAVVGSIGVIYAHVNALDHYKQYGFDFYVVKTGTYKDTGADWRSLTEEEKERIKETVSDAFNRFVFTVAKGRGLSYDHVERYADGSTWDGENAINAKLIDAIGNFDTAVSQLNSLTGLKNPKITFFEESESENTLETSERWDALRYQLPSTVVRNN